MDLRWRSPLGLAVVAGLIAFAVLSLVAGLERRGLTWWDPPIIAIASAIAYAGGRLLASRRG